MKTVMRAALCVMLCTLISLVGCSNCAAETIDLSGMNFAELVDLQNSVNLALWNSEEWEEVTVPEGVWTVGEDIPAGKWTIRAAGENFLILYWCDRVDQFGAISSKGRLYEWHHIKSPEQASYKEGETSEITLTLQKGQYVEVSKGSAVFTPYTGNHFSFRK